MEMDDDGVLVFPVRAKRSSDGDPGGCGRLLCDDADSGEDDRAGQMQEVVRNVQPQDVQARPDREEAPDAQQQVSPADRGVDAFSRLNALQAGDQERRPDQQMSNIVQSVDLVESQNQPAVRGQEAHPAGKAKTNSPTSR